MQELLAQAVDLASNGQIAESLTFMDQAVKKYPGNPQLRYHYALLLAQNAEDYHPALAQLQELLKLEPSHIKGNFLMGELLELGHDLPGAVNYYKVVAENDPDYPEVFYRLGVTLKQGDPEAAAKYLKKAVKSHSKNPDAYYQYALLLSEVLDKPEKAVKYFQKTLELDKEHLFANYDLAVLYHREKEMGKARKYYQKAIKPIS